MKQETIFKIKQKGKNLFIYLLIFSIYLCGSNYNLKQVQASDGYITI